jgi:NosR/NirI family transcriptional regulator, nitrous oxide reductase regulator
VHFQSTHFQAVSRLVERLCAACIALTLLAFASLSFASPAGAEIGKLRERLSPEVMAAVFPAGAERLGDEEGSPPAIAIYQGGKVVAYVFSTLDIIAPRGYSSTPFDVIGGVDLEGRITGSKVVFHREPYIIYDTVRQRRLDTFLLRDAGRPIRGEPDSVRLARAETVIGLPPDYVAGATISARAMRAGVLTTAGLVLRARTARTAVTEPTLDVDTFRPMTWEALLTEGAVVRRRITAGEVAAALAEAGATSIKLEEPLGKPDDLFSDLYVGLASPLAIGGSLVGLLDFEQYKRQRATEANTIILASVGPYNFLGTKFFRASEGNRFDRLRIVQEGKEFGFVQRDYQWTYIVNAGARGPQTSGLFALRVDTGFDPLKPWRLELLVHNTGATPATVAFSVDYKIPPAYVLMPPEPEPPPVPAWVEAWHDARANLVILGVLLSVLTLIFMFQAQLARHRLAHRLVRNGFLLVVVIWLGWMAGVQLSIVNVMNYVRAPFISLDATVYLAEPLMFIVAVYTLISLLLIGRGVFCGWLCPFGAMQELLGQIARALRLPQWNPSAALEKRLWMGKYIAAVVVLTEIDSSGATTEIEPFKTAIISKFTRAWPFVLYAGILLAIGLFSERAYCRFLCPLGGVLAFLDRLHLIDRLKRRPECGNPCHLCERSCPVRAIEKTGKIVTAECFQCLDCQVEYYDDKRCPPLVALAKRRDNPKANTPIPVAARAANA